MNKSFAPIFGGILLATAALLSSCSFGELPDTPSASDNAAGTNPANADHSNDRVNPSTGYEGITDPNSVGSVGAQGDQ